MAALMDDPLEDWVQQQPPPEVYMTFAAMIDQLAVQRFLELMTTALHGGKKRFHLMIQTTGGSIQDGICLYNFFRGFPAEIIAYNIGTISSAGVTAYLGASRRVAAPTSTFMLHRGHTSLQGANAVLLQARAQFLLIDEARVETIVREHVKLSPEQKAMHDTTELWLTAEDAVTAGVATELGIFAPPPGALLINVFG